ncbi:MAG: four helix bundle protein [Bacteroidetes bacterium]|nr:four helix bundle protein [Bacteroidota bacterium]
MESTAITDYKQLRIYQRSFGVANRIFDLTSTWPRTEQYMLVQQTVRSSRSVCANIGEAWFKKWYPKHFVSKLSDAGSEAMETIVWLDFALHYQYITSSQHSELTAELRKVVAGLVLMCNQPEKWCYPPKRKRRS